MTSVTPVLSTVLNSLIFSKLFYCSTVWTGTSKQNLQKLQLVQHFAVRLLTDTKKFDHISPVLRKLGWPSIKDQLLVRYTTQVYKLVNGLAPLYLSSKLSKRSDTHRYNTRERMQSVTAQRSFYYHSVSAWTSLSADTRISRSLCTFKRSIKRELRAQTPCVE